MIFKLEEESGITRIYDDLEELYDFVFALNEDDFEAIEVSNWAELAAVEETYIGDGFTVTAREE